MEVKKAIAEELPPGWIREIRVTRIANRIRRDSVIDHLFPLHNLYSFVSFALWICSLTIICLFYIFSALQIVSQ